MSSPARINPPLQPTLGGAALLALGLALSVLVAILVLDGPPQASAPALAPPAEPGFIERASAPLLEIPDDDTRGVEDSVVIDQAATVAAVELRVEVEHLYPNEVTVELVSPLGTVAELYSDDESPRRRFHAGNTPALGELAGEPADGTWTLRAYDDTANDVGTLSTWSLAIETS